MPSSETPRSNAAWTATITSWSRCGEAVGTSRTRPPTRTRAPARPLSTTSHAHTAPGPATDGDAPQVMVEKGVPVIGPPDTVTWTHVGPIDAPPSWQTADASSPDSVRALIRDPSDVLVTTVGPFAAYGRVALDAPMHAHDAAFRETDAELRELEAEELQVRVLRFTRQDLVADDQHAGRGLAHGCAFRASSAMMPQ